MPTAIYQVDRLIYLRGKRNVTIRSESGDPTKCVLRGKGWDSPSDQDDILRIGDCRNITVAGLTFTDCHAYGIKVQAEDNPENIQILKCRFRDIGTRAIKGSGGRGSAKGGSIRYCHFSNSKVPPAEWLHEGNYITAIDMMGLDGWTISDNVFENVRGRTGAARAAIFIWVFSKNVTVERNLIVNCDRGIAFGNPSASTAQVADDEFHVQNSVCRNNFIVPGPDAGIELWWVDGVQVYNNTIWRPEGAGRGIRFGARSQASTSPTTWSAARSCATARGPRAAFGSRTTSSAASTTTSSTRPLGTCISRTGPRRRSTRPSPCRRSPTTLTAALEVRGPTSARPSFRLSDSAASRRGRGEVWRSTQWRRGRRSMAPVARGPTCCGKPCGVHADTIGQRRRSATDEGAGKPP